VSEAPLTVGGHLRRHESERNTDATNLVRLGRSTAVAAVVAGPNAALARLVGNPASTTLMSGTTKPNLLSIDVLLVLQKRSDPQAVFGMGRRRLPNTTTPALMPVNRVVRVI